MPNPAALLSERKLNFHFKSLLLCFFSTICIMKIPCMELYSDSPTWVRLRENPNLSGLYTSLWVLPHPAGFCSAWNAISPQPRLALGPAWGKCSVELDWTALHLPVRAGRSPSPHSLLRLYLFNIHGLQQSSCKYFMMTMLVVVTMMINLWGLS